MKNLRTASLYLHCEECEMGYRDPEAAGTGTGFLTLDEDFDAEPASLQEIEEATWDRFYVEKL